MNQVADKKICKQCKQVKLHVPDGNYPSGRDKRWRDEHGGLWAGRLCSVCNKLRLKEVMQNKRKNVQVQSD